MHKGSFVINPVAIDVIFGEPVETTGLTLADRDTVIAEVRDRVQRLLDTAP
jgi:hypothetical protein